MKRVVAISDLHCGHLVGLTPPGHWRRRPDSAWDTIQGKMWDFYAGVLREWRKEKPIDILMVLGDACDGKGKKSGGSELTLSKMDEQAECAAECIEEVEAKSIYMVYGTPYHVSEAGTDYEDMVAKQVKAKAIGGHLWVDVNGHTFDLKHKIGSSSVPQGRSTPVKKEEVWNALWAERGVNPRSDTILRGHAHYFDYTGNHRWLGVVMPALQGPGSKFGVEQCSGIVDFGLLCFDVDDSGRRIWKHDILEVVQKVEAIKA